MACHEEALLSLKSNGHMTDMLLLTFTYYNFKLKKNELNKKSTLLSLFRLSVVTKLYYYLNQ